MPTGSGSIIEALRLNKRLIVVINELLMDNHQQELALAMEREGYLRAATCGCVRRVMLVLKLTCETERCSRWCRICRTRGSSRSRRRRTAPCRVFWTTTLAAALNNRFKAAHVN